jgi:hypothetical protein
MVDLNRKIRATQARQGGFSSHVLPGAVEYESLPGSLIYHTSGGIQFVNAEWRLENLYQAGSVGPSGYPSFRTKSGNQLQWSMTPPGAVDDISVAFTLETYLRARSESATFSLALGRVSDFGAFADIVADRSSDVTFSRAYRLSPFGVVHRSDGNLGLANGGWKHFALCWDPTEGGRFYVGGQLIPASVNNEDFFALVKYYAANYLLLTAPEDSEDMEIDQIRFTYGRARYSGQSFSPPRNGFLPRFP